MHRVELKVNRACNLSYTASKVPNAPCGVESNKQKGCGFEFEYIGS